MAYEDNVIMAYLNNVAKTSYLLWPSPLVLSLFLSYHMETTVGFRRALQLQRDW